MKADCPAELLTTQGTNVKFFNDFENPEVSVDRGKWIVGCSWSETGTS